MQPNPLDLAMRLERTSEQLRLVLPLMSRHGTDFGPESYALWFGYIAADRPDLVAELAEAVAAGARLTAEQTAELHNRHFRDAEAGTVENVSQAFIDLLMQVANSTSEAQAANQRSQAALQALPPMLPQAPALSPLAAATAPEPGHAANALIEQSRIIAASLLTFGQQLNRAQSQVDALRAELHNVRQEARIDALTSLQNRRAFDEALELRIDDARNTGTPLSLIMIDVDHFKRFNDTLGHVMGDKALRAVATAIQQNVKGKDFVARFGGEEFVVLLADTPLASARRVAENLCEAIGRIRIRKSATGEIVSGITVSCGVAPLKTNDAPIDLLDRADVALYLAKDSGRNRVVVAEKAAAEPQL